MLATQSPRDLERVRWVPNPRVANGTWVSDPAGRLSPLARDSINALIAALERETTSEIAVVVAESLSAMEPQLFALSLHRAWGVGKAAADNGIVLLWAPNERQTYVSVGTGLEGVLSDRRTGRILDEHLIPAFRRQAWDEGVYATVAALAAAAREETNPRAAPRRESDSGRGFPKPLAGILLGLGGIGGIAGGGLWYRRWKRLRPRKCARCGTVMRRLDEVKDDDHLDQGDKAEERERSVDWDVWECPSCHATLKIPYTRTFSGDEACPKCKRRTARAGARRTLTAATTVSSGTAAVDHLCSHCGHSWITTETIPRISTTSSSGGSSSGGSSSGGGSGFGGGSARGGGAGRSY